VGAFAHLQTWSWWRGHLPPLYNLAMEQQSGAHRRAPHDHGRLGDPVVADAVAASTSCRAPPTRCRCCTSSWSGLPMVMVAIFISMADSLLYP